MLHTQQHLAASVDHFSLAPRSTTLAYNGPFYPAALTQDMTPQHRSSLGMLLRRSKSGELRGKKAKEAELERQRLASLNKGPPKLPEFHKGNDQLSNSFGNEMRPDSVSIAGRNDMYSGRASMDPGRGGINSMPAPPPLPNGGFDPYARTESMTHRGRYSYASSAISTINSPRRVRRRKDPTPFNILIIGTRNAGKTSFLEFLKTALALPAKKRTKRMEEDEFINRPPPSGNFIPHYIETEIDGERVGLTLWDSEGLEKNVVDLQLREMSAFLESKFEETFTEEMKVVRSPGVQDTHIHAAFLILDPSRLDRNLGAAKALASAGLNGTKLASHIRTLGALDEDLDLQVMRTLQGKTTVIPVISKADTITTKHMSVLKRGVWDSLKRANLDPLESLTIDEDDNSVQSGRIDEEDENELADSMSTDGQGDENHDQGSGNPSPYSSRNKAAHNGTGDDESPFIPMSIISPDVYEPGVIGRQFPWGFADPYNEEHCDFTRLKEAVFSEWRGELREVSREQWYEGWRTSRLKNRDGSNRRS